MSIRDAAQAVLDSLDRPETAVERLRLVQLAEALRAELKAPEYEYIEVKLVRGRDQHGRIE